MSEQLYTAPSLQPLQLCYNTAWSMLQPWSDELISYFILQHLFTDVKLIGLQQSMVPSEFHFSFIGRDTNLNGDKYLQWS